MWDYQALYIDKDVRDIAGGRKNVKGSLPRYKKRFCLHCMVSFCNEELHICEGRCRRCLQHHIDHDCNHFDDDELDETAWCIECEHDFRNEFCYAAHLHVKLNGRFKSYCELLRVLDQCDRCISEFELIRRCCHKRGRKRYHEDGGDSDDDGQRTTIRNKFVRCGYCSESYLRGSSDHRCFLSSKDSVFANAKKRSKTITVHNVFYFDIESCLETRYECKFQKMDVQGNIVTTQSSAVFDDRGKVDHFEQTLSEEEASMMMVSECKSHLPALVCVINSSGSLKIHFCEKELGGEDPICHFLLWCADDIIKKTNALTSERNDYVFVAHNASRLRYPIRLSNFS